MQGAIQSNQAIAVNPGSVGVSLKAQFAIIKDKPEGWDYEFLILQQDVANSEHSNLQQVVANSKLELIFKIPWGTSYLHYQ